jgi:hypothetical protein
MQDDVIEESSSFITSFNCGLEKLEYERFHNVCNVVLKVLVEYVIIG